MAEDEVSKPCPLSGQHLVRAGLTTLVAIFLNVAMIINMAMIWRKGQDSNLHTLSREPAFRAGAIPFRSPFQTGGALGSQTQSTQRLSGLADRCIIVLPVLHTLIRIKLLYTV